MAKKVTATFSEVMSKYASSVFDNVEKHSTGIRAIDKLLNGGIVNGYMYYFFGTPGAGKSTIVFQIIRTRLKQLVKSGSDKQVVFIDVEKAFNERQQECFGLREFVESGKLVHLVIGNMSELDDIVSALVEDNGANVDMVAIDSTTMLRPVTKQELRVEDVRPGIHALQMSFMLSKIKDSFYRLGITSLVVCQSRANMSLGAANPYAPEYKMAGGFAEAHSADVVFKIEAGSHIKDENDQIVGNNVRISATKNKFGAPKVVITRELIYGKGISLKQEVISDLIEAGIINKVSPGYYEVPGVEGRVRAKGLLELPNETISMLRDTIDSM